MKPRSPGLHDFWMIVHSVFGDDRPPTPSGIQADLEDALGFPDVDVRGNEAVWKEERVGASAEVVIIIFRESREPVGEGVLCADAYGPAATSLGCRSLNQAGGDAQHIVVIALPGAAALHID